MTFQAVVNGDKVVEHRICQFVAFIKDEQRVIQKGDHADSILKHIAKVGSVGRRTYLFGNFTNEVAFLHVFRTKDIEHVAVFFTVVNSRGSLSASGIADHPGDVLVQLGIRQHKSNIL